MGKVRDAEAGFIEAIRQQSDDRSRWLIFADWLEERGDAHGELIRLQVHLSELPADDPGRGPLEARESELFRTIPEEKLWFYPPRIMQDLKKAVAPIAKACRTAVGGMVDAFQSVGCAFGRFGKILDSIRDLSDAAEPAAASDGRPAPTSGRKGGK